MAKTEKQNESEVKQIDVEAPGLVIQLRDQREYLVLLEKDGGWLVAELNIDFTKTCDVKFWRKEFLEHLKKNNRIIKMK